MSRRRKSRIHRRHRRRYARLWQIGAIGLLSIAIGATVAALTASNTVATSLASNKAHTISVPELTPADCTNASFYVIVDKNGTPIRSEPGHSGDREQIWLGTSGRDQMRGGPGADCMLPGGNTAHNNETTRGGGGNDYCYSGPGPGPYAFNNCENGYPTGPYTTIVTPNPTFS